jgi:hypothetical protein
MRLKTSSRRLLRIVDGDGNRPHRVQMQVALWECDHDAGFLERLTCPQWSYQFPS